MEGKYLSNLPQKKWPLIGWPSWLTNLRPSFWWEIAFCPPCPNSKNGDFINKLLWGKCNFLRIWLYYITLQKYDRFHLCLMKWPNRMLRNFSYFLEYTKNSWFLFLNECGRAKVKLSKAKKKKNYTKITANFEAFPSTISSSMNILIFDECD